MASHSEPTSDTSCTSAEPGKDWIAQVDQRNQLQHDSLEVSSYHSPDLQVSMFTDEGFSPSLPRISCIPSVDTTWQSIPLPHLSWKTPAYSVSNYTPNTLLSLSLPLLSSLIKQCKDKLSIHIKFIHYSDILFLRCLLRKQTHTNPKNNH